MTCTLHLSTIGVPIYVGLLGLLSSCAIAQGAIDGGEYKGPNGVLSVRIPKASNWAGVPYAVTNLNTPGNSEHDGVMFHAGDFGTYVVAGAGWMTADSAALMDKDDPRAVLRNLSQATLMQWRKDLAALPPVAQESFVDTPHGQAIVRVYRAEKGSFLARAQGRRPTREDTFDTNIASMLARRGPAVVYVLAQYDSTPNDAGAVTNMADELFRNLTILPVRSAAIVPQSSVAHVEDCAVWGYRDNDHFGAINKCKDPMRIQFMLTNDQRVIEREVKPGEFFDTELTSNQVERTRWLFTACPVGYVPSVPFLLKHEDEIQASRYNCSKK